MPALDRPAFPNRAVLVIEDDGAIGDLVQEVVEGEGYPVYLATNGARALELLSTRCPALIMLDMHLPDMSWSAIVAGVDQCGCAAVPIVVMTAETPLPVLAGMPRIAEVLHKPFDLDALVACVARYVL